MIAFSARASVPEDVLVSDVGEETVILNLSTERYFGLDEASSTMWRSLTTAPTIQSSYETLLAQFEVDPKTLKNDLTEWVLLLVHHGLVQVDSP